MRIPGLLPVVLLAALATPVLAQPQPAPSAAELQRARAQADAWQAYALRVAKALGRSDGARDLALAALLDTMARPAEEGAATPTAEAAGWRERTAARGAGDAITQQLLLAAGIAGNDGAAVATAARRWQALDPGNLAPLLLQGLEPEALLAAAAGARHHALDPYPLQRWVAGVLRRHPPGAAEWAAFGDGPRPSAEAYAAGWAASLQALLAPDYRAVLGACTGRQLRVAGRAEACRHLSSLLLARPQTALDERIGLSMARALTRSAAERAPLDARRRGVDWRQEQMAALAMAEGAATGQAEAFARLLADPAIDTEDALVRRALADAGLAQEPPAGWRAPWEQPRR